jgi:hypothetical protein
VPLFNFNLDCMFFASDGRMQCRSCMYCCTVVLLYCLYCSSLAVGAII